MFALMLSKELYRKFLTALQSIYTINEATVISDWVFESIGGLLRFEMIKNPEHQFTFDTIQKIETAFEKLLNHSPVQYVVGEAWFYKMKFYVNHHVLIPRPETEELVDLVINDLKENYQNSHPKIIEIGTGSGCISIAIKKNFENAFITALDFSKDAMQVAKINAEKFKTDIKFLTTDFLNESYWNNLEKFDVIVSNPPYIPVSELEMMDKNVTDFEPHSALFVPEKQPLLFYEKIAKFGQSHLNKNGKIFVETHENYANEVAALFASNYPAVAVIKDMFGKDRIVTANRSR